ncbi:hypothetical protein FLONG3_7525 [Fusarium longipes]|uniref:Uncharacterized protein n=1 Tax=Fusarium longipes TaxID=694270 RepID=A0A395SDW1_9HYPO|nr:hypothetical protein FLONG3_7525 [Fusarium longipes]
MEDYDSNLESFRSAARIRVAMWLNVLNTFPGKVDVTAMAEDGAFASNAVAMDIAVGNDPFDLDYDDGAGFPIQDPAIVGEDDAPDVTIPTTQRQDRFKRSNKEFAIRWLTDVLPKTHRDEILTDRVRKVIQLLYHLRTENQDERILVVSCSVMFLDVINEELRREDRHKLLYRTARYDGTVDLERRIDFAIRAW